MPQIDKFIEALHRYNAADLEVAAGAQITMGVNGARHTASAQPVSPEQVERLLQEIMPQTGVKEGPQGQYFTYDSPSGTVQVNLSQNGNGKRLLIEPMAAGGNSSNGHSAPVGVGTVEATGQPSSRGVNGGMASGVSVGASVGSVGSDDPEALDQMEALFMRLVDEGCSDLHLCAGAPPLFRKDGDIVNLGDDQPMTAEETERLLMSITPPHKRAEYAEKHDVDFAYEIPDVSRYRCNLFLDRKGVGGVFRAIPTKIVTTEELGLPEKVVSLCELNKGLVVVTGPTGSGKSTTLAALVDYINRNRTDHVITIEDPIEFVHENKNCLINQREVGVHTAGFKVALRAALREDPDVVLVGEMRDLETVEMAIETAETGHLVFGTLHTNTAPSTVDRIIDQFPADQQGQIRTMLSESLKGVISQTLVKAVGGGRVAALEVLLVNSAVSNLIREGKTYQIPSVMQTSKNLGMRNLNDALLELVMQGTIEPRQAYLKAVEKSELETLFSRNGISLQ